MVERLEAEVGPLADRADDLVSVLVRSDRRAFVRDVGDEEELRPQCLLFFAELRFDLGRASPRLLRPFSKLRFLFRLGVFEARADRVALCAKLVDLGL